MKFRKPVLEFYRVRSSGRWQWRLIASNGMKLCRGSQARGFADKRDAWLNAKLSAKLLGTINFAQKIRRAGTYELPDLTLKVAA